METTVNLCSNCVNTPTCFLRNGHAVMYCEEHTSTTNSSVIKQANFSESLFQETITFTHYEGLCGHCELKDNCTWREPDAITFRCEHYQ